MKFKILFFLAGTLAVTKAAQAQKYITAAGVRVEKHRFGLTVQQRVLNKCTIEFLGMAGTREVSGTAIFQRHFPIITNGLNYYIGAGAHVGHLKERGAFYGADGVLGFEAKVLFTRLLLSADLKPAFHINHEDYFSLQGGFSLRYILIKQKKTKLNLFGSSSKKKESGGLFGTKSKEKEESSFNWFGKEEETKEKKKFRLFPSDESEEEEVKEKKKFKLFE